MGQLSNSRLISLLACVKDPDKHFKHFCAGLDIIIIIIITIINDNVYGAVSMTMVTAGVHPVHLMNAD